MPIAVTTLEKFVTSQPDVVAAVAGLRRVGRPNCNDLNAVFQTLVFQEIPQLVERPAIAASPFHLIAWLLIGALPNACQVFNRHHSAVDFGIDNDGLADVVVEPSLITSLLARQPFQQLSTSASRTACAFRAFALDRLSCLGVPVSHFLNRFTVLFLSFARHCDIPTPKVNANHSIRVDRIWRFVFELNVDVILSVAVLAQLGASWHSAFEFAALVVACIQFDVFAALNQRQANFPVLFFKREDPGIVVSARWSKSFNRLAFKLCRFAIGSHSGTDSRQLDWRSI